MGAPRNLSRSQANRDRRLVHGLDTARRLSIRRAGHLHHFGVGRPHAGTPVLILTDPDTVTVINPTTGEVLSEHDIDPTHTHWRTKNKSPGGWPRL